jgi:hypothetical protein
MEKKHPQRDVKSGIENVEISPKSVSVREYCSIKIRFKLRRTLRSHSMLIFRLRGGRNNKNDWYYLQAEDPDSKGYAKLQVEINSPIDIIPLVITGKELSISYLILNPTVIPKNTWLTFSIKNTLSQSIVESNKKIEILLKNNSKYPFPLKNPPSIDVKSAEFDHMNLITPSIVKKGVPFNSLLRVEDKYHNLVLGHSSNLKFSQVDFGTNKKKLLKECGSIAFGEGIKWIKNLQLNNEGIFYIEVECNSRIFKSNIMLCIANDKKVSNLYWGYIHGHTKKSDGVRSIRAYFENLKKAGLDFGTSTEHDRIWETSDKDFKEVKTIVNEYNKDDHFTSLFGYEYGTWYTGYGDICIYHRNKDVPILRSEINKFNSTRKLFKNLRDYKDEVLLIAHHTALRPGYRNWEYYNQSLEKLVEIYSTWGNQEYAFSEGNPIPPRYKFFGYGNYAKKRGPILGKEGSYVKNALQKGYKLGFVAGGDDHIGVYPSGPIDMDNGIYPSGIMAVWSNKKPLTEEELWKALTNRKCYGTTGSRVIVKFWLDEFFMGDIIQLNGVEFRKLYNDRTLSIEIISPLIIKKVQIIRNNEIFADSEVNSNIFAFDYSDNENFDLISLIHEDPKKNEQFCFYYPRIFLANNQMAWASPIWLIKKNSGKNLATK